MSKRKGEDDDAGKTGPDTEHGGRVASDASATDDARAEWLARWTRDAETQAQRCEASSDELANERTSAASAEAARVLRETAAFVRSFAKRLTGR